MQPITNRLVTVAAGALCVLLAGVAANAEDVELFVGDLGIRNAAKPNVVLILDDSGSMDATVETQIDYDPSQTYSGNCVSDRVYWSRGRTPEPPSDSECSSTDNWIEREAFVCQRALNAFEVLDGGTYTDRMVQYQTGSGTGWWDLIDDDYPDRPVECEDDWGEHGDGSDASAVYPQDFDTSNPWSSSESDGIRWSGRTRRTFTVYEGNYVNWLNGPTSSTTRMQVMQDVAANLINSISGVNIGVMSFNHEEGGLVRHAASDVSAERSSLISTVNGLSASNWTPLSETLYEAHQYYRGSNVVYGSAGDPDAFDPNDSSRYASPAEFSCQKNHVVLLTDGEPTRDHSADSAIESLTDAEGSSFSELTGNATCDTESYPSELNPDGGRCLDDLAAFMHEGDLSTLEGQQNVTTHTVGFHVDLNVLEQTASRGGGRYHTANDTGSLTSALTSIVTSILDTRATFVAPAVSVNAFNQTRNLNDLYFSVFEPSDSTHWPGNLKKYQLRGGDGTILDANGEPAIDEATGFFADTAQSFWSPSVDGADVEAGGAANRIPNPRSVYTYLGKSDLTVPGNRVAGTNQNITDSLLGTDAGGTPTREQVIDFVNGLDAPDRDMDGVVDESRHEMGDPLHARPATVIYGPDNDDGRIYFATNDGYLHSIDSATGVERWAFVPEEFLDDQVDLYMDPATPDKLYGIDSSPIVQVHANRDNVIESDEKVYLFFGVRRGGNFYYGLDVTNPDSPQLLWRLDDSDLPGVGQSWAPPTPARIDIDGVTQNDENMVLVIGGGYDTSQDNAPASTDDVGNAMYIIDSETGDLLWHASDAGADANFSTASGNNATMEYSMPAAPKVVDINSDGLADRIYAGDMGGQVWRFDVFNGESRSGLVTGGVIAQLGAAGLSDPAPADTRRFYNTPDTAFVSTDEQTFLHVGIGSGYRAHPNSTDTHDRFYAIRDYSAFTWRSQAEFDNVVPHNDSDFVDVANDIDADVPAGSAGWKFEFTNSGEKVLAEALTFDGEVFFNTFRPGTTGSSCRPSLGVTRQYRVSLFNGSPVTNLDGEVDEDDDGEPDPLTSEDRFVEDEGSILSRTTVIFVDEEDTDGDGVISEEEQGGAVGCTETDCSDLDFDDTPRRTFWTQESVE